MAMGEAAAERRRGAWLAGGLLFAGLLATALVAWYERADADAAAKAEFDFTCSEIRGKILSRLSAYGQVLHGGAAFFESAEAVTRPQWRRFVERQELGTRFAGIQGLGFARLISRRQLAQHVLEIRAEGFPAYQVSPAGERELYSAIIYLEPFRDRNLRAFGYDMLSEPVRREAMERARDQDTAALSGKVVLVQETGNEVQAGTLMYVPVYQAGMPIATVAQRRAAIRGWVYSPYRMADLLRGILGGWDLENNGRIRLEVYDGERVVPENLLYDSRSAGDRQTGSAPRLNSQEQVVSAGRRWTLRFTAAGSRAATAGYGKVWLVAFGGTGASLLLAWLLFDLLNARVMARQLSNREEELRTMAEAMPQIVWIARPDGWNIFLNKLWMDYTGLTLEESLGHAWVKAVHPDDQGMAMEAWQKARAEHGIYSIEGRLRRADGVYRWWLVRAVPLLDAAGNILKWYGTCTDIHDLKMSQKEREEMQSQLNQSQKMETVGQLAGGVAHDFNNLLTAIIGYGGFLMKDLAEGDAKREDVKEILTAAERAAGLTKQLLAFSRKQILKTETVDLNSIVWGIGKMLRRLIGEDIKLETRYAPSPCHVQIDIGQIEQMIVNLAVNARDAMPKGGTLVLATAHMDAGEDFVLKHPAFSPGPLVCLTLKDTGCGMTDNTKEHLFEPFFTTKEKGRGSGLGLSTVFGIVKQSGGEIEVESAPDRGTTFNIYLPHFIATAVNREEAKDTGGDTLLPGSETVLLVEDEESLRRLGERLLRMSGYTVISAANGAEALEVMERHGKTVDLLLTDVVMPGMSGRELSTELWRRKLVHRTLFMSGYTDEAISKHGVLEPGLAFIYKPFTVEALSRKLREVLDGPADKAKP